MSIDMIPHVGGRYKTISTLSWADIPGFAILTGRNGSGKTQLLELLAYHFSGARPPGMQFNSPLPVEVRVSGQTYQPEEIAYVPSAGRFSGGAPSSLATLQQTRQQALQHAQQQAQNQRNNQNDIYGLIRGRRLLKRLGGHQPNQINQETLEKVHFDSDFASDDIDITAGLAHVFVAHRLKMAEALERDTPGYDEDGKPLGPSPWDVVNETLLVASFPYEVVSPQKTKLLDQYALRLKDRQSGVEIAALDLSSGEKVLLQLVLWLYTAGKGGLFPKLLLLDEPDAHLHPSMTTQFLDVISEVLVNRHGVRVIMTTHSPSTVAKY
jgi:energy-coupling factor transporter ATP-binding protein EcfA2